MRMASSAEALIYVHTGLRDVHTKRKETIEMRTMLGVITLVSALLTGMSQGGHYKLSTLIYSGIGRMMDPVLSENMPLCQAYARNLNSYAP